MPSGVRCDRREPIAAFDFPSLPQREAKRIIKRKDQPGPRRSLPITSHQRIAVSRGCLPSKSTGNPFPARYSKLPYAALEPDDATFASFERICDFPANDNRTDVVGLGEEVRIQAALG